MTLFGQLWSACHRLSIIVPGYAFYEKHYWSYFVFTYAGALSAGGSTA